MPRNQTTIQNPIEYTGVGLHTGLETTFRLKPAGPDQGVVFTRVDLPGRPRIPASAETITSRLRRTCIRCNEAEVQTIEHLLSCLAGMGIDNLDVEINGPEVPGADGSALPFLQLLRTAGKAEQPAAKKQIHLPRLVHVQDGDLSLVAIPAREGLTISYTFEWWSDYGEIQYSVPVFAPQHFTITVNEKAYEAEIAPARTFVASVEADKLRSMGLGRGATYKNTLVVGPQGVIENELRFPNEFARHKILDLMGDLFLLGAELDCHMVAIKSGHNLNMKMVKAIRKEAAEREHPPAGEWIDVRQIQKILPHRFPFLLVDRVLELEDGKRAVGLKNITANEPYFQGHFPGFPVMPGVLQIEAMAQVAGLMLVRQLTEKNKLAMLLSLDRVKLRKAVVPGDQMLIEAVAVRIKERTGEVKTKATVDGKVVTEAQIRFMIVDVNSL
ncbi:MAG: UDP-3-O-[3-hydroxymyristoyl] N-acetylglucosamine deacetylase [Planctomycetes bacterium]|nr:UDP-3-O-[3-hydroxymyristoyl] N-acetylglucosamine deacetylase [Planctomycetota bacterium]